MHLALTYCCRYVEKERVSEMISADKNNITTTYQSGAIDVTDDDLNVVFGDFLAVMESIHDKYYSAMA